MDNELEVIRDEMEETRANLATKLEALETQVRQTVSSASETVSETVEGVKEVVGNVTETVGNVTETFNISKHVERNPWLALGIAVSAGFVAGQLLGGGSSQQAAPQPAAPPQPPQPAAPPPAHFQASQPFQPAQDQGRSQQPSGQQGGLLGSLEAMLPDMNGVLGTAMTGVSGLAIGTVMSVVREVASSGLPQEWRSELTRMIDDVTRQLGGKIMQAPSFVAGGDQQQDQGQQGGNASHSSMAENETEPGDKSRRTSSNRSPVGQA